MTKIALVTGSSRGIGRATVLRLAEEGFDVTVNYHRSKKMAMQLLELIRAMGRKAIAVKADLSKWEEAEALVGKAIGEFGRVDVLVNNAGIYERTVLDDLTPNEWDKRIATNLSSMFYCTKAALSNFKKLRWGRIINISSQIGFKGTDHGAEYAASKAGVIGFTKSAARELARYNVTVNAIAPGPIDTDILAGDTPEKKKQRALEIPLGRLGTAEDVAAVVSFLASRDSDWMTGTTIHVNGGSVMY